MEKEDVRLVVDFFNFTKDDYEYLVDKCMFNVEMATILKMKIYGESNVKIADALNISEATLSRRIKEIKRKIMKVL